MFHVAEHDALIVLPVMRPSDAVSEAHLIMIRNTVIGKGISSVTEFRSLLHHSQAASPVGVKKVNPSAATSAKQRRDPTKRA